MQIIQNLDLAKYTSFQIGGQAKYAAEIKNEEDLKYALDFAHRKNIPVYILSGGTNILFDDEGYEGLILLNRLKQFVQIDEVGFLRKKARVSASAGVSLKGFLEFLAMNSVSGYENLYGVPGSLAGALRGNAGAFSVEISDNLEFVEVFDILNFKKEKLQLKDLKYKYRHSLFKEKNHLFILSASFNLNFADKSEIIQQMNNILIERNKRQLQNIKSAGSFYKNPLAPKDVQRLFEEEKATKAKEGRVPAGWLIEKLGFKGYVYKGVKISDTSANYFINIGSAKSKDVLELSNKIKQACKERFNIDLEEEVQIVKPDSTVI